MEQAPEKRAVFLCSLFLPKPESSDLLVKNVDFKTVPIQLCFGLRRQDFELSTLLTERLAKLSADGTLDNLTHPFLFQAKTENEPETIDEKK